jgi:hypothetical protein
LKLENKNMTTKQTKKSTIKLKVAVAKVNILSEDLANVDVPFDLFTGLSLVVSEVESKGFTYQHLTQSQGVIIAFESVKLAESIIINVEKENLLIRQFSIIGDTRKLKVVYVVKPSERTFKLV